MNNECSTFLIELELLSLLLCELSKANLLTKDMQQLETCLQKTLKTLCIWKDFQNKQILSTLLGVLYSKCNIISYVEENWTNTKKYNIKRLSALWQAGSCNDLESSVMPSIQSPRVVFTWFLCSTTPLQNVNFWLSGRDLNKGFLKGFNQRKILLTWRNILCCFIFQ